MLIFFAISSGLPEFFSSSVTNSCSLSIIDWSNELESNAKGFDARYALIIVFQMFLIYLIYQMFLKKLTQLVLINYL